MPLFLFIFHIFITYIHSFNHIHAIHISVAIRRGLYPSLHCLKAPWEKPPCGAEPRIELGPAVQQADVLPTEPRLTITEPRLTIQNIELYHTVCKRIVDSARSSRLPQELRIFYFCTCIGEFCYTRKIFWRTIFVSTGEADGGYSPSHPRLALGRGLAHRDGLQGRVPVFLYQMVRLSEVSLQGQDSCNGSKSRLKYLESAKHCSVRSFTGKSRYFSQKSGHFSHY